MAEAEAAHGAGVTEDVHRVVAAAVSGLGPARQTLLGGERVTWSSGSPSGP